MGGWLNHPDRAIRGVERHAAGKGTTAWSGFGPHREWLAIMQSKFDERSTAANERRLTTMTEYEFTLLIEGDLTDQEVAAALFDAGCDDATFGISDGQGYGEFLREASSFTEAVLSAIHQVESVAHLRVVHVEPDDIVTAADIAERLDRTRESVRLLIAGRRGPGSFPAPISHGRDRGRLWRWSDVVMWLDRFEPEEKEAAQFVAAANASLELRSRLARMTDEIAAKEVRSLV
jgi:hypothetical protein